MSRSPVHSAAIFLSLSAAPCWADSSSYGSGCGPQLSLQGATQPGAPITITVTGLSPGGQAWLLVGASSATSAYGPLPLPLPAPPFASGCALLASAELIYALPANGPGSAALAASLPSTPADYHLYLQALAFEPSSTFTLSQGLDVHAQAAGGLADVQGAITQQGSAAPIGNARVTLFLSDLSFFRETRSEAAGAYAFASIPPSTYRLGVAAVGYDYQEIGLTLVPGTQAANFALGPETHPGSWSVIGNTAPETFDATDIAFLRTDAKVMFCHDTTDPVLFDPQTGTKSFLAGSTSEQGCMNGSLLASGASIFCGGQNGSAPGSFTDAISWVKLFQPQQTWSQLGDMLAPTGRWYPGLARLADGRLLVMGGGTAPLAERTDTCEVFDPATQQWSWTGTMGSKVEFPPSALLWTGKVLRTWGTIPELYAPASGTWTPTGQFASPLRGFPGHSDHSLVVLGDGRAVVVGINTASSPSGAMVEYYDPTSASWTAGLSPSLRRMQCEIVHLPDGHVLVQGGDKQSQPWGEPSTLGIVKRCDLLDPQAGVWRRVADTLVFREYHAVTLLLRDARVLTTGGTQIKFQIGPTSANIDAYRPPYLFRGVRPQISNLSTTTPKRGETVSLAVFPDTQLTSAVLMGVQSTTHWVDGGIPRRLALAVQQAGSAAQVALPADPNLLPVGWYLLFGMVDDIPSEAAIVRVDP